MSLIPKNQSIQTVLPRRTHPQPGGAPEPDARVPGPPLTTSPAAPPASAAARSSPGCGGRTPASAQSGSSGHVQAEGGKRKEVVTHGQKSAIERDSKDSEKRHSINEDQFTFYEENYSCHQGYLGLGLRLSIKG